MQKYLVAMLFIFSFSLSSLAQIGDSGGGMDSGGGNGLPYRLKNAVNLSIQVLAAVTPEDLQWSHPEIFKFYSQYRTELIIEAATANLKFVPADQVYAVINGQKIPRPMMTELRKGAAILVADSLNVTNPAELTQNVIHEYGHHLGITQDQDSLLDQLSLTLVMKAMEKGISFFQKEQSCMTSEELLFRMTGKWTGKAKASFAKEWNLSLEIFGNGQYSDQMLCNENEDCSGRSALYYGSPQDDPRKQIRVQSVCAGNGNGFIDIVFLGGTVAPFRVEMIKISPDWNELSFQMIHAKAGFPIYIELVRKN